MDAVDEVCQAAPTFTRDASPIDDVEALLAGETRTVRREPAHQPANLLATLQRAAHEWQRPPQHPRVRLQRHRGSDARDDVDRGVHEATRGDGPGATGMQRRSQVRTFLGGKHIPRARRELHSDFAKRRRRS